METVDKIKEIIDEFRNERAFSTTFEDAFLYAEEYGDIISYAFENHIKELLQDGYLLKEDAETVIKPILETMSNEVSNVTKGVQQGIIDVSGIKIKAQSIEPNQSKIDGIIQKVSSDVYEKTKWILGEPITNLAQSVVADTQKKNVEWQSKAGLKPRIERRVMGKCCDWCENLAGVYEYPDGVPDDIYRRHERCRCITEYIGNGKRQDVWSKKYGKMSKKPINSGEYLKNQGIKVVNDSKQNIPQKAIDDAAKTIQKFTSENKEFIDNAPIKLKEIRFVDSIKGHSNASGIYREKGNIIEININSYNRRKGDADGYYSKSDNPKEHIFAHEYGHFVADALKKTNGTSDANVIASARMRYFNGDIFGKISKSDLSYYGTVNDFEAFAEAFAEAETSKNPRGFAKIFKEELEKAINK